ncbi:MAG TPA: M14 family metallopeptidase [Pyrinomonadaceae bacterium]|nr:M14 family metallopeptidase [Pyrinomonadaceae bacterium]
MRIGHLIVATALLVLMGISTSTLGNPPIDFSNFHTPTQLDTELTNLAAAHPTIAQIFTIGTSVEGRSIRGIKISDNVATNESSEGDVVFVGLHHAREWISAEMALYLAEYLLTNYATDPALQACMNNLQIWIIPVVNPDGYAYSASTAPRRCWRKNRRNNGDGTFGVDLNRNYSYQWGFGSGAEGSNITSEDTYRGPSPFSEPETIAVRDFVQALQNPTTLLTYHSYSELFLRPWSYTNTDPPGEPALRFLAQDSIARIAAVHGHTYAETIWYNAYGETTDYFWNQARISGFTPELRPSSAIGNPSCPGFDPPASTIIPTLEENVPAALALIKDAGCKTLWIKDHNTDTGAEPSAVWTGTNWSHAFWVSPDIWTVPATLIEGATVTLNVRVHNDGGPMNGSKVAAYYTDPRISLEFPNPGATLIGEQTVNLPSGDTTVTFSWVVPTGTNSWGERHWCVGAIVSHPDDRPLTTQIQRSNNIGGRNFQTTEAVTQGLSVAIENFLNVPAEYIVTIDRRSLPRGWEVVVPPLRHHKKPNRKALLLGVKGNVIDPGETIIQPIRLIPPKDYKPGETTDIHVNGVLIPLVPGKRAPVGNGYTFRVGSEQPQR